MKWLKDDFRRGFLYDVVFVVMIFVFLLLLYGCGQRLTKSEWEMRYPADVNTVKARLMKEQGEQKIKDSAEMAKMERLCVIVAILCIPTTIILVYLKLQSFAFIPVAVLFGCGSGIAFIEMNSYYPKLLPLLGAGFVLVLGAIAVYYLVAKTKVFAALKEVVGNVEDMKKEIVTLGDPYRQNDVKDYLINQSLATKSLVAGIRKKINSKTTNP